VPLSAAHHIEIRSEHLNHAQSAAREQAIVKFTTLQFASLIYLQKFAFFAHSSGSVNGRTPRRMSWRHEQAHGAIVEEVALAIQFEDVQLSNVAEITLAVDWPCPSIGPEGVSNFLTLEDVSCLRKVEHTTRLVEMQVRINDIAHILRAKTKPLLAEHR